MMTLKFEDMNQHLDLFFINKHTKNKIDKVIKAGFSKVLYPFLMYHVAQVGIY